MKKKYLIIVLSSISSPASAYIGPGMGGGVIAGVLGVLVPRFLVHYGDYP